MAFYHKIEFMENKTLSIKDLIYLAGIFLTVVGAYFALKAEIQTSQLKTEAAVREQELNQKNSITILELKISSLQLQVANLEAKIQNHRK
jgi:hypothetical protein